MTRHLWVVTASGAQVVALASGAVTNLLYARLLPIEVVGRLAVVIALASGLGALADAGLQLLLTREVAAGRIRGERVPRGCRRRGDRPDSRGAAGGRPMAVGLRALAGRPADLG